jgi:hypothetical protein
MLSPAGHVRQRLLLAGEEAEVERPAALVGQLAHAEIL